MKYGKHLMGFEFQTPTFNNIFGDFNYGKHMEILGGIGTGKSNIVLWFFKNCKERIIIFNPLGIIEYNLIADITLSEKDIIEVGSLQNILDMGYKKISISLSEEFIGMDINVIRRFFDDYIAKQIFLYEDKLYTEYQEKIKGMTKGVHFKRRANLVLLIDELLYVCEGERLLPFHRNILFAGRNHGISHIGLTQRNQHISKLITTQSYKKIIFRLDQYDIHALRDKIKGVEYAEDMKDFHFMVSTGDKKPIFYLPIENQMHSDIVIKGYSEVKR